MSTLANVEWTPRRRDNLLAAQMPFPVNCEEISMREKLTVARDTIIVFALQMVFRAMMLLRHWNY
jgi:hypothetical protein